MPQKSEILSLVRSENFSCALYLNSNSNNNNNNNNSRS